eukprot:6767319-Prymnesium_polylepis.1
MMRTCNGADTSVHIYVRTGSDGHPVPSAEGIFESSPAAVRSVERRRAIKASSRTVELIDGRNVGSVSASSRRAALQWICVAGVHRATKARKPS